MSIDPLEGRARGSNPFPPEGLRPGRQERGAETATTATAAAAAATTTARVTSASISPSRGTVAPATAPTIQGGGRVHRHAVDSPSQHELRAGDAGSGFKGGGAAAVTQTLREILLCHIY